MLNNSWRETYNLRFLLTCFLETWYFYAIAVMITFLTIAIVDKLEQDQVKVKNDTNNSEINHEPKRGTNQAFAESYNSDAKGVSGTAAINPSDLEATPDTPAINLLFEENRPEQLIAPESFGKTYDYYIDNLRLYFVDREGKTYELSTRGMAVKIGSPVLSVVYLDKFEPNQVSDNN